MMGEEETIESFEDRVLNKRAAQLHRNLSRKFDAEQGGPLRLLGMLRRSENKKQAATKFYSCLVLSKVRAVEIDQEDLFSDLVLNKTEFFEGAASSL
jgi:chromatin segregation and condensation protein Rec8/ScpA/Scc1 (kleisin family)